MGRSRGRVLKGPPLLRLYLTGFGPFGDVSENPSATLVKQVAAALSGEQTCSAPSPSHQRNIPQTACSCMEGEHVRDRVSSPGLPVPGAPVGTDPIDSSGIFELCGWEVLEVSAAATTDAVPRIHGALRRRNQRRSFLEPATGTTFRGAREPQLEPEEGLTESAADMTEEPLALALHFGVSMHSDSWRLEMLAKNDARFPCTDSRGCRPATDVITDSLPLEACLCSSLCLEPVAADLRRQGFPCSVSEDAGCFVCNFVYFKSLQEGQTSGVTTLFVHIPPFSVMSVEKQLAAALRLLTMLSRKEPVESQGAKPHEGTLGRQGR